MKRIFKLVYFRAEDETHSSHHAPAYSLVYQCRSGVQNLPRLGRKVTHGNGFEKEFDAFRQVFIGHGRIARHEQAFQARSLFAEPVAYVNLDLAASDTVACHSPIR